jgi:HD superfamily phosphohydrolase
MAKVFHEIRDPIHVFIHLDSDERRVLDCRPVQRLRHIHQLALSYQVYPAATHKRLEHSLGVMELASRVFDIVCHTGNFDDEVARRLPELKQQDKLGYWRRVLRMAALCHDTGHLPFSHAAEEQLLPAGWDHEKLTRELIMSQEMRLIWNTVIPPLNPEHIVKVAVGPRKAKDLWFSDWETILAEIIVGDALGVDRMDYLLRDSYHIGVSYGRFDHYRLIDTMRILISPDTDQPALGIEEGGLQSAEALLLARYLMYSQVYFHSIRRIYDIHLRDFLQAWLPDGKFSVDPSEHLRTTDNEINSAIHAAARDGAAAGHESAKRIVNHSHFKVFYERHPKDVSINPDAVNLIFKAAKQEFRDENVRCDQFTQKGSGVDFPVLMKDGKPISSLSRSGVLQDIPVVATGYVYVVPEKQEEAKKWLSHNRQQIISPPREET